MTMQRQQKKCKNCNQDFKPFSTLENTCSPKCKRELAEKRAQKREESKQRKVVLMGARGSNKSALPGVVARAKLIERAQRVTNRIVKLRDWGKPCISCGKPHRAGFEAGHFHSVGAHPELRLMMKNIHGQCSECNHEFNTELKDKYACQIVKRYGFDYWEELDTMRYQSIRLSNDEIKTIIMERKSECDMLENQIKEGV